VGRGASMLWMYTTIGFFVLLLACINFMNLATARSQKRAKEVGIRKTLGSMRSQLITQFLSESVLIVIFSFFLSLVMAQLLLPLFNEVADKKLTMPWTNAGFWLMALALILVTGLVAGSYPAFYLSSFSPIRVLKGTFQAGRFAAIPRKILLVLQFSVSIVLIIGVTVVYRQIHLGKNRPAGYQREGLLAIETPTSEVHESLNAVRNDLKLSGTVTEIAESVNPVTMLGFATNGLQWDGKPADPNFWIGKAFVSSEYGKTIGWQIIQGRDFSRAIPSDSNSLIVNESLVKYMGLNNPVGTVVRETIFGKTRSYTVIGVVKDMLMQSPFHSVKETIFMNDNGKANVLNVRLNPDVGTGAALSAIEKTLKRYAPSSPFEFRFIDTEFARKFSDADRVSKLAGLFAILAILKAVLVCLVWLLLWLSEGPKRSELEKYWAHPSLVCGNCCLGNLSDWCCWAWSLPRRSAIISCMGGSSNLNLRRTFRHGYFLLPEPAYWLSRC